MSKWTWTDTLVTAVLAWLLATGVLVWQQARMERPQPTRPTVIVLDTVGCGHVVRCVPAVRARWASVQPFAGGE